MVTVALKGCSARVVVVVLSFPFLVHLLRSSREAYLRKCFRLWGTHLGNCNNFQQRLQTRSDGEHEESEGHLKQTEIGRLHYAARIVLAQVYGECAFWVLW